MILARLFGREEDIISWLSPPKEPSIIICMAIFDNCCQIIMNTTGITDHLFATYVDVLKCNNADHFESAIFLKQFAFTCCRIMAAVIVL